MCLIQKKWRKDLPRKKLATIAEPDEAAPGVALLGDILSAIKQDFERDKTWNWETSRLGAIINNQEYGLKQSPLEYIYSRFQSLVALTTDRKQQGHEVIKRFFMLNTT